jgi:hypothetical protein
MYISQRSIQTAWDVISIWYYLRNSLDVWIHHSRARIKIYCRSIIWAMIGSIALCQALHHGRELENTKRVISAIVLICTPKYDNMIGKVQIKRLYFTHIQVTVFNWYPIDQAYIPYLLKLTKVGPRTFSCFLNISWKQARSSVNWM